MQIKLYGVRGSIASPSVDTVRYGGNTACVYVENNNTRLIFDAGTGIRKLGDDLPQDEVPLYLFFSHYHWDHIQGFPFFSPVYQKNRKLFLLSDHLEESPDSVLEQMADPHFPIPGDNLQASIEILPISEGRVTIDDLTISTLATNHPGGGCAYRIDSAQGSFAYITDNELFPPGIVRTSYDEWSAFLQGVDVLLHDAMYLDDELPRIHGWGHSLIPQVLQLAVDARAANVVLFHHDPNRTDTQLDKIAAQSQAWMAEQSGFQSVVHLAVEGHRYVLEKAGLQISYA